MIADRGNAILPKDIEKLGCPFEEVENQFTKTKGGSGLCLAISKSLVELHGGSLTIDSETRQGHHRCGKGAGGRGEVGGGLIRMDDGVSIHPTHAADAVHRAEESSLECCMDQAPR